MEWLVRYFSNPSSPPPIDMSPSMCVHGNLDLNKIQDVKAVDDNLAEELYREVMKPDVDQSGGGGDLTEKLTHEKLCGLCVRNRCRSMKLARSLSVDHKIITELLKQPVGGALATPQTNGNSNLGTDDDGEDTNADTTEANGDDEKLFWVGKNTLKKWRALAREALDEKMRLEAVLYLGKKTFTYFVSFL